MEKPARLPSSPLFPGILEASLRHHTHKGSLLLVSTCVKWDDTRVNEHGSERPQLASRPQQAGPEGLPGPALRVSRAQPHTRSWE